MSTQKNDPRALALGVSCYVIWGFFPLYFSLLSPAGAVVAWSGFVDRVF